MSSRLVAPVAAIVGTVVIGVVGFWLSFFSLAELSSLGGLPEPRIYGIPIVVDGATIVATISVATLPRRMAWYPWAVLGLASAASLAGNAVHAILTPHETATPIAVAIAVTPPIALLLSTHLTVLLIEHARAQHSVDLAVTLFADPAIDTEPHTVLSLVAEPDNEHHTEGSTESSTANTDDELQPRAEVWQAAQPRQQKGTLTMEQVLAVMRDKQLAEA